MDTKDIKTTIYAVVGVIGLLLAIPHSPLYPLVPESVHEIGVALMAVGRLGGGIASADAKK